MGVFLGVLVVVIAFGLLFWQDKQEKDKEKKEKELFEKLTIELSSVKISNSGAFTIKAGVSQKEEFCAFESVHEPSTIDGTLSAELYQKGDLVGSALLVFPVDGIVSKRTIEGMGLSGAKQGVKYEVRFKPYHLCEIDEKDYYVATVTVQPKEE